MTGTSELKPLQWVGTSKRTTCAKGCSTPKGKRVAWDPNIERFLCETHGLEREAEIRSKSSAGPTGKGTEGASSEHRGDASQTAETDKPRAASDPPPAPAAGPAGESRSSEPESAGKREVKVPTPIDQTVARSASQGSEVPSPPFTESSAASMSMPAPPQAKVTIPVLNVEVGPEIIAMLLKGIGGKADYAFVSYKDPHFSEVVTELGTYAQPGETGEDALTRCLTTVDSTYRQAIKLHKEASSGGS